jgi:hypothetical protein
MKDPTQFSDFNPGLYPSCDGQPLDLVPRTDRHRAVKARFLAAYYRINVEYARLRALRQRRKPRPQPADERATLQALEKAIRAREALEDRYASRGILASPFYQAGFVINVQFQCPGSPAVHPIQVASSSCRSIAFAMPARLRRRRTGA